MPARRFSPLALMLCLVMVFGLGTVIVTMTGSWSPYVHDPAPADLRMANFEPVPDEMAVRPPTSDEPVAPTAGPRVSPAAAPGVAFTYLYAFRVPAGRIAEVQERHARTCDRLGTARCRITGMHYRFVDARNIEARLALKVEPNLARRFGQAATASVGNAGGRLIESEINGTEVAASVRAAGRSIAAMTDDLERIRAELSRGNKSTSERQGLEIEAQQLRDSIRAAQASREQDQESLAATPMHFHYAAGEVAVPAEESSIGVAAGRARDNLLDGVAILLIVFATMIPWAVTALLVWWIFRLVRGRADRFSAGDEAGVSNAEVSSAPAG